jgi:hypothetical protein
MNPYYPAAPSSTLTYSWNPKRTPVKEWSPGSIDRSPYDPAMIDPFSRFEKAAQFGADIGDLALLGLAIPKLFKRGVGVVKAIRGSDNIAHAASPSPGLGSGGRTAEEISQRMSNANWANHADVEYAHVRARAKRLIAQKNKWVGQHPDLKELLETAVERHDPFYMPSELGGAGKYRGEILSDFNYPMGYTSKGKKIGYTLTAPTKFYAKFPGFVARHEVGHYYTNLPREANDWMRVLDKNVFENIVEKAKPGTSKGTSKYMFDRGGDEIRERAAQLKDFIAERKGIGYDVDFPITRRDVDDALAHYLETHPDNNMTEFIGSVANRDLLTYNMNRYSLGAIPFIDYDVNNRKGRFSK